MLTLQHRSCTCTFLQRRQRGQQSGRPVAEIFCLPRPTRHGLLRPGKWCGDRAQGPEVRLVCARKMVRGGGGGGGGAGAGAGVEAGVGLNTAHRLTRTTRHPTQPPRRHTQLRQTHIPMRTSIAYGHTSHDFDTWARARPRACTRHSTCSNNKHGDGGGEESSSGRKKEDPRRDARPEQLPTPARVAAATLNRKTNEGSTT